MKQKNKGLRLIWVDWLILTLVVACALGGAWLWKSRKQIEVLTQEVIYTLFLENVDLDYGEPINLIPENAVVTNERGTARMGRVVSVEVRPTLRASVLQNELIFVEDPQKNEVFVRIKAQATLSQDGARVQDTQMLAGMRGDFRIGSFLAKNALVIDVKSGGTA